jgi:hypothetical protein
MWQRVEPVLVPVTTWLRVDPEKWRAEGMGRCADELEAAIGGRV